MSVNYHTNTSYTFIGGLSNNTALKLNTMNVFIMNHLVYVTKLIEVLCQQLIIYVCSV